MNNVRELAYDLLILIYQKKAFSNIELNSMIKENDLNDQDKSLLTTIVYGTIKETILLDYEIDKASTVQSIDKKVRILLRSALYQIRRLDKIPNYAVLNETVNIAKKWFGLNCANFVNAILRNLSSNIYTPKPEDYQDDLYYKSIINSIPTWIVKLIFKQFDDETLNNYIEAYKVRAPLCLRVNNLKAKKEYLDFETYMPGRLYKNARIYVGSESLYEKEEFKNGEVIIQGESSQLVAPMLDPQENETILDMCAAPGGKTFHIAELMHNTGRIIANDIYDHKIKLIEKGLNKYGISNVKCTVGDSKELDKIYLAESFDRILLDAPCSGLGIIRRKPDILLNIQPENLDELVLEQQKLLNVAYKLLKKGGTMVYSTCTINRKENDKQMEWFLKEHPDMKLVDFNILLPSLSVIDGFFIAKLIKGKK